MNISVNQNAQNDILSRLASDRPTYPSPRSLVGLSPIGLVSMFFWKIVSSIAIFIYGVQARLDMAKCAAGFDWVRTTRAFPSNVIIERNALTSRGFLE